MVRRSLVFYGTVGAVRKMESLINEVKIVREATFMAFKYLKEITSANESKLNKNTHKEESLSTGGGNASYSIYEDETVSRLARSPGNKNDNIVVTCCWDAKVDLK